MDGLIESKGGTTWRTRAELVTDMRALMNAFPDAPPPPAKKKKDS